MWGRKASGFRLLGAPDPLQLRQVPGPVLLQAEGGVGAGQLPAHEGDLLLPREGGELDVVHVPGVGVFTDPGARENLEGPGRDTDRGPL